MSNVGIKDSWSLIGFSKIFGTMKVATFTNSETKEEFASCAFVHPETNKVTLVGFSSNLGELTPKQIKARKNELQVVQLNSGNYKLCEVGEMGDSWETVDLGL